MRIPYTKECCSLGGKRCQMYTKSVVKRVESDVTKVGIYEGGKCYHTFTHLSVVKWGKLRGWKLLSHLYRRKVMSRVYKR